MTRTPVDVVDRVKPNPKHGTTWHGTVNAFLDELNRRDTDRQSALDALTRLARQHPELDTDADLTEARLALLR